MERNTNERAIKTRNRHKNRIKGVGKLEWIVSLTYTVTSPPREGESAGTQTWLDKTRHSRNSDEQC